MRDKIEILISKLHAGGRRLVRKRAGRNEAAEGNYKSYPEAAMVGSDGFVLGSGVEEDFSRDFDPKTPGKRSKTRWSDRGGNSECEGGSKSVGPEGADGNQI